MLYNARMHVDVVMLRRSPVRIIFQMIAFLAVLTILEVILTVYTQLDERMATTIRQAVILQMSAFATIVVVQTIFSLILLLRWVFDFYEVRHGELYHHSGILWRREEHWPLRNVEAITSSQSLMGRIFRYGTLRIQSPIFRKDFSLPEISDVERKVPLIQSAIVKEGSQLLPLADVGGESIG